MPNNSIVILSSSPPRPILSESSTPLKEIPSGTRNHRALLDPLTDDEFPSTQPPKRRKTTLHDDLELFTSSSPSNLATTSRGQERIVKSRDLQNDVILLDSSPLTSPEAFRRASGERSRATEQSVASGRSKISLSTKLSANTAAYLAKLAAREAAASQQRSKSKDGQHECDTDGTGSVAVKETAKGRLKTSQKPAGETPTEKEARKRDRELAKAVAQAEKKAAREQKARDKQKAKDLAAVNTLKLDKKKTVLEMTAVFPDHMIESTRHTQVVEVLRVKGAAVSTWRCSEPIVKWKRTTTAEYDAKEDIYRDVPEKIVEEDKVLVILEAESFCKMLDSTAIPTSQNIEDFIRRIRACLSTEQSFLLLVEGLEPWRKKYKNAMNRAHAAAVRAANNAAPTSSQRTATIGSNLKIDDDMIEDALLSLQITYKLQIHHTATPLETAEWIGIFTEQISLARYKRARLLAGLESGAGFCIDVGQVKSGNDKHDTYDRSLQEILRVTPAISQGIAVMYPSLQRLYDAFLTNGPLAIENLPKMSLAGGVSGISEARIGPAISKRLHRIFTSTDPDEYDI